MGLIVLENSFVWSGHRGKGIYFVTYDGHVKRGVIEVDAHEIEPDTHKYRNLRGK